MFRRILTNKWKIAAVVLLTAAVGAYFWFQRAQLTAPEPIVETDETDRETERQTLKRKDPTAETPPPSAPDDSVAETEEKTSKNETAASFQTSSNPMFADGVPEHLQCPEAWVGLYRKFKGDESELRREFWSRLDEILSNYNPRRPLTEVYPLFIESEKRYASNADPKQASLAQARGRLDWLYQSYLDYPEIFVLDQITNFGDQLDLLRDKDHFSTMRLVSIGDLPPDLNVHTLMDGRKFRARDGYNYEEILTEKLLYGTTLSSAIGFGHSGRDAPVIKIYTSTTSNEELEKLSGWDYNINPYTEGIYKLPFNATEQVLQKSRSKYGR